MDELNKNEILRRLREKKLNYEVVYKESADSANNVAKAHKGKKNLLIAAGSQTAGKGRYGRSFASQSDKGVYFTLKINRDGSLTDVENAAFFPLTAALAVNRAVFSLCGVDLTVKWPNDLLYKTNNGYNKVCGILTEAAVGAGNRAVAYVIVGIGLNLNNDETDFPDDIKNTALSLKMITGKTCNRADMICGITGEFSGLLHIPREELLLEYQKKLLVGVDISFTQNGSPVKGRALRINENGNLVAKLDSGEETTILSGEVNFI